MTNKGICNACNKEYPPDAPNMGYFCNAKIIVKVKNEETIQNCKGVVILHRGNGSANSTPTQRGSDNSEMDTRSKDYYEPS